MILHACSQYLIKQHGQGPLNVFLYRREKGGEDDRLVDLVLISRRNSYMQAADAMEEHRRRAC